MRQLLNPFLAFAILFTFSQCQPETGSSGNVNVPADTSFLVPADTSLIDIDTPELVASPEIPEVVAPDPIAQPPVFSQEPINTPVVVDAKPDPAGPKKELKDLVPFTLGVAVQLDQMKQKDYIGNVRKYFDRVTFVNDLKMKSLQNSKGEFNFKEIDKAVDQYIAWGIPVHGHTLVYAAVVNDYLKNFKGDDKEFEAELKRYVQTVVSHFKDRVKSWDVLNEPWDATGNIEQKVFVKRMGVDYMKKVFTWAHEADPRAILFINDYNLQFTGKKTKTLVTWLKECKAEGIPVHGVGNQMHTNTKLDVVQFKKAVKMVTDLGMYYHVSELEVKVFNPVPTEAERAAQTKTYQEIFNVVRGIPLKQNFGITLWGLSKPFWFENAKAGKGKHVDDPLLLGDSYKESEAYIGLMSVYGSK